MTAPANQPGPATQPAGRSAGRPAGRPAGRVIARNPFLWNVSKTLVLLFCKLWFRHRVEGAQHVPAQGAVLLVANHSSYLDPPLVGISTARWVGFLAQAGLASFAPLRWWMAQMGVTLIDRNAPSKEAMRLVADNLGNGEAVGMFPEGTRSKDGAIGPFRTGVEFLLRRTGAVVVPVGIDGASRAMPRGALLPRPRRVVVRFGAPWTAEQVLAPGGVEALRRQVAELANAPLRAADAAAGDAGAGQRDRTQAGAGSPAPAQPTSSQPTSAGGGT